MDNEISVIAFRSFRKAVKKLFSETDLESLSEYLADFPESGNVIPGTNGLRKLRWALGDKGKKGGSRVIYYYYHSEYTVLLLTAYAKNEKKDLTAYDKKALSEMVLFHIRGMI